MESATNGSFTAYQPKLPSAVTVKLQARFTNGAILELHDCDVAAQAS